MSATKGNFLYCNDMSVSKHLPVQEPTMYSRLYIGNAPTFNAFQYYTILRKVADEIFHSETDRKCDPT